MYRVAAGLLFIPGAHRHPINLFTAQPPCPASPQRRKQKRNYQIVQRINLLTALSVRPQTCCNCFYVIYTEDNVTNAGFQMWLDQLLIIRSKVLLLKLLNLGEKSNKKLKDVNCVCQFEGGGLKSDYFTLQTGWRKMWQHASSVQRMKGQRKRRGGRKEDRKEGWLDLWNGNPFSLDSQQPCGLLLLFTA